MTIEPTNRKSRVLEIVLLNAVSAVAAAFFGLRYIEGGHSILGSFIFVVAAWPLLLIWLSIATVRKGGALKGMTVLSVLAAAYVAWSLSMSTWCADSLEHGKSLSVALAILTWFAPIYFVRVFFLRVISGGSK